jgi:hypothetical protein
MCLTDILRVYFDSTGFQTTNRPRSIHYTYWAIPTLNFTNWYNVIPGLIYLWSPVESVKFLSSCAVVTRPSHALRNVVRA